MIWLNLCDSVYSSGGGIQGLPWPMSASSGSQVHPKKHIELKSGGVQNFENDEKNVHGANIY